MANSSFLGSGWSFPPTFEKGLCQVQLTHDVDNINQSINLIMQTSRGQRALQPFFGSELKAFLYRKTDATLKQEISSSVTTTLLHDEPRIAVNEVNVSFTGHGGSEVQIHIAYTIKQTNTRHNHVFPFSLLEGTNLVVVGQNGGSHG